MVLRRCARGAVLVGAVLLAGCRGAASTLEPSGPRAALAADLWWLMFWLSVAIFAVVLAVLAAAVVRGLRQRRDADSVVVDDNLLIVGGGIVLPLIVLPVLWVATLRGMRADAAPPAPSMLTVEVVGRQWAYEVRYPQQGITLANEMRLPAGQPVTLRVSSTDVIHSFWVPRLMGKVDMLPGKVNETWLLAAEPGTYLVECAEFCGLWHAKMHMSIVAEPPAQFATWLADRGRARD
jgi:cytochrome c oxidase subunit II